MPPNANEIYLEHLLAIAGIYDRKLSPRSLFKLLFPRGNREDSLKASARSALNNNGAPVQFVVSTGPHPVRVLVDVAYDVPSQRQRLNAGLEAAVALSRCLGFQEGLPGLETLLQATLPTRAAALEELEQGAIWLAVGYGAGGADRLSIYANSDWGIDPYECWLRPFRLLTLLGRQQSAAWLQARLPSLVNRVIPAGSALDYDVHGLKVIKLYFRSTAMDAEALVELLAKDFCKAPAEVLRSFAYQLFPERGLPQGTFITLFFKPTSETPHGIKVDACAHCTGYDDGELLHRWTQFAAAAGAANSIYPKALALFSSDRTSGLCHSNLGVGISDGQLRLDAYFRPKGGESFQTCANAILRQSLQFGIDFLLRKQQTDGHWEDFALPVGASDTWVTAVVGRSLASAQMVATDVRLASSTAKASRWLLANENESGGWGYNKCVPVDSDSTAHAAIFLMTSATVSRARLAEVLIRFQCNDGGFATYREEDASGAWALSHPDVTPVVALALAGLLGSDANPVRRALAYCRRNIRGDGSVPSYWWRSEFYATAMVAVFFAQVNESVSNYFVTSRSMPISSLDTALAVMTAACVDIPATATVDALIQRQRRDGSWQSSPQLCVTAPECYEPWAGRAGYLRCFDDNSCLFTTAIAVQALALVLRK